MAKEKGSIEVKCKEIWDRSKFPKNILSLLDGTGDTRIEWDPDERDEVDAAKSQFKELMKLKGAKAYSVGKDGKFDEQIHVFNKRMGEIVIIPQLAGG